MHDELESGLGIAAAWAHKTWLENTDAADYGIEVKFYAEEKIAGKIIPTFQRNGIHGDDVIWFDGERIEGALGINGRYSTFGGKKLMLCTDKRFTDYEWIFCVDADMFVMSRSGATLPFFEKFFGLMCGEPMLPAFWYARRLDNNPDHSPIHFGYYRDAIGQTTPESIAGFEERVTALMGSDKIVKALRADDYFLNCSGVITAFPAKHFMAERWDDCQFFNRAAREVTSGELPFVLWAMNDEANTLHDLTALPFPMITLAEGMPVDWYQTFIEAKDDPFLLHYASTPTDAIWLEGINAI